MTPKQKRFCDEYLLDCNATQAAIRAGYSPKTARQIGQKNLSKVDIANYIQEQMKNIHDDKIADVQEILKYLTSVMRGECKETILQFIGDGIQEDTEIPVSVKVRLKAAELLGKRYGIFKEGMDVSIEPIVIVNDLKE